MEMRSLRDLKASNPYLRLGTDVSDLEKSIERLGLIAPIVVSTDNVILAGARRYQALLNLGRTETEVIVKDGSELERELISIDENLVRKDLSKLEVESHLRRAKEIYQALNPAEEVEPLPAELEEKREVLPAERFLTMVAEKTGMSPKQIHEAIQRDEQSSAPVKELRAKGKLSVSQTNEIVKLPKEEQKIALDHVQDLPLKEIKKFVKVAKSEGVEKAIRNIPDLPFQKEFQELNSNLKKVIKRLKQFESERVEFPHFPEETQKLFGELMGYSSDEKPHRKARESEEHYIN